MKKLFFVFAFLAFACGSDDDNNNEETSFVLVGTWEGTITEPGYDSEGQVELVLNSDSTGTLIVIWGAILFGFAFHSAPKLGGSIGYELNILL